MPQQNHELQTFEYHFKFFQLYHNYFSFISLGWENWKYPQKYSIDNFGSSENQFIFQYTVSGEGAITINSHTHVLRPGQAFLIERPGATPEYHQRIRKYLHASACLPGSELLGKTLRTGCE